ncbi:MAG: hypothetical protein ACYSUI_14020 [Planctomycetota bacterium]|jgi:hypothetical protein
MARTRKKLGDILLNWGVINANALADALQYATDSMPPSTASVSARLW